MSGCIVFFEDGIGNRRFMFPAAYRNICLRLEIVDVETQNVSIFDGMSNGVGMQLLLKNIFGSYIRANCSVNLLIRGIFVENGCSGKSE